MKIKLEMEIKPFNVPNFVIPIKEGKSREDGFQEPVGIHLSELDSDTLEKMCEEFRKKVFNKAGKNLPPKEKFPTRK